jgi:hypothetical protein
MKILSIIIILLSPLGPNPEPECDAAVASLVEMGFSEVKLFLLIIHRITSSCFFLQGKSSFNVINTILEYK